MAVKLTISFAQCDGSLIVDIESHVRASADRLAHLSFTDGGIDTRIAC